MILIQQLVSIKLVANHNLWAFPDFFCKQLRNALAKNFGLIESCPRYLRHGFHIIGTID